MNILVVEDEKNLANAIVRILSDEHINAEAVYDGADGLKAAQGGGYDAVILDLMLPSMSGMEIIKQRANANKLLGRTLKSIQAAADIRLVSIDGGKKDNAIPRAAQTVFVVEAEAKDTVKQAVQTLQATISHEYQVSDPDVTLKIKECTEAVAQVMNRASIYMVSDMAPDFVRSIFMTPFATVQEAYDAAQKKLGGNADVIVMPYGGSTLPQVENA